MSTIINRKKAVKTSIKRWLLTIVAAAAPLALPRRHAQQTTDAPAGICRTCWLLWPNIASSSGDLP